MTSSDKSKEADEDVASADKSSGMLYGWLNFHPECLQRFNTINWLVTAMSSLCMVQGTILNGLVPAVSSTVATRFQLSSTQVGVIVATYDLTVLMLVPFVSYALATRNKARWLAAGALVMAIGALAWSLPHFTSGLYVAGAGFSPLPVCELENVTAPASAHLTTQSLSNYFYSFLLAQVLLGIGAAPIYTVGYAWVDENTTTNRSGWYIGILSAMSNAGIALGYVLGAVCLSIYTDIQVETDLTPSDEAWVGAWWLGFLIASLLALLSALPVGGFSSALPETVSIQAERKSQAHQNGSEESAQQPGFGTKWSDIWPATKMICSNPPFMMITLSICSMTLYVSGVALFLVSFMENQFGITSSVASILAGSVFIPAGAFGSMLGGWIIKKANLKVRGNMKFMLAVCLVGLLANCVFFLRCPDEPLAGVFRSYDPDIDIRPDDVTLDNQCNADCHCTTTTYDPVCGVNGIEYFDACYAGCQGGTVDGLAYYNCSCVESGDTGALEVISGKCPTDCWQFPVFIFAMFFLMVIGFLPTSPMAIVTMRTLPDSQRSFGLGIQSLMYRLLGSIPGSILFGAAIDHTCLVWEQLPDNSTGSCWIYDGQTFGRTFVLLGTVFLTATSIFLVLGLVSYKAPEDVDPDAPPLLQAHCNGTITALPETPNGYGSVESE